MARKLPFVIVASMVPAAAMAQDFSGAATVGYGPSSLSHGGGDVSTSTVDATGMIDFNNGVFLGLDGKFSNIDPDLVSGDLSLIDLGSAVTYQFANGATVGAYLVYADADLDTGLGFDLSGDATSFGITGGYVADGIGVEFHYGETDTSPSLGAGVDWTDFGVQFRYQATETAQVGAHHIPKDGARLAASAVNLWMSLTPMQQPLVSASTMTCAGSAIFRPRYRLNSQEPIWTSRT